MVNAILSLILCATVLLFTASANAGAGADPSCTPENDYYQNFFIEATRPGEHSSVPQKPKNNRGGSLSEIDTDSATRDIARVSAPPFANCLAASMKHGANTHMYDCMGNPPHRTWVPPCVSKEHLAYMEKQFKSALECVNSDGDKDSQLNVKELFATYNKESGFQAKASYVTSEREGDWAGGMGIPQLLRSTIRIFLMKNGSGMGQIWENLKKNPACTKFKPPREPENIVKQIDRLDSIKNSLLGTTSVAAYCEILSPAFYGRTFIMGMVNMKASKKAALKKMADYIAADRELKGFNFDLRSEPELWAMMSNAIYGRGESVFNAWFRSKEDLIRKVIRYKGKLTPDDYRKLSMVNSFQIEKSAFLAAARKNPHYRPDLSEALRNQVDDIFRKFETKLDQTPASSGRTFSFSTFFEKDVKDELMATSKSNDDDSALAKIILQTHRSQKLIASTIKHPDGVSAAEELKKITDDRENKCAL